MTTKVKPYTGKRILLWFIGFFLVVFLANGIMAYFALNTWTGLSTDNSYVKGLNYNKDIEDARVQSASGWSMAITSRPENRSGHFEISVTRPQDSLPPAQVTATFIRPVREGFDQEITLSHIGNDVFGAAINLPLSGQWDILIVVKTQNNLIFKREDRLLVN